MNRLGATVGGHFALKSIEAYFGNGARKCDKTHTFVGPNLYTQILSHTNIQQKIIKLGQGQRENLQVARYLMVGEAMFSPILVSQIIVYEWEFQDYN